MPAESAVLVTPDRRERKKRETRRRLQVATLRLAAEHGLARVTAEQIAAAADVSPRTFFNYFPSKEAALAGEDPERDDRLRTALVRRPAGEPPLAALRAVLLDLAAELVDGREEWQARLTVVRRDPHLLAAGFASWNRLEQALALGVAERTGLDVERDLYPSLLVASTVGALRTAALRWGADAGSSRLPALVAEAIDMLGAGLPPPSAAREERPTTRAGRDRKS
ncbi:MAG TPA: TetR family transcriptional regulator [Nocardioidaceae bacterium]|nr:TetR family transcriptional regulator [Nocardioidaceae bacterium]